jgi:KipI family sensor histidine kinase inhibitor
VLFLGFAPGFPYIGDLAPALVLPRLATPRTSTPAGSVGIAEAYTGIYPAALPAGWRIIGRTAMAMFDPATDPPTTLLPGDLVRFEAVR